MASVRNVFCIVLIGMAGWSALAAAADPAAKPNEERQRAARLKLLRQLAEKVQVSVVANDGKSAPVKMLPEPLYRYQQESRHFPDAIVCCWGDGGRPAALLTLACYVEPNSYQLIYEFDSLSPQPLVCRIDGQERWSPQGAGLSMTRLANAPAPSEDQPGRLQQISRLTARMKADEVIIEQSAGGGAPTSRIADLAWLPQPVYHYSDPAHGIVDGAVSLACIETNPEVVLVLEAQRHGNSLPAWYCGFNRVTYAALHVRFDDKELWTAPSLSSTSAEARYHLIPITLRGQ